MSEITMEMRRQDKPARGLAKRLRDAGLERVSDPRQAGKVKWPLAMMLEALVVGVVTMARSLRGVEARTAQIARRHTRWSRLRERIPDNTLGHVLPRLAPGELVACLHRQVKAERRRKQLRSTRLRRDTVSVDGKHVATLRWADLCRAVGMAADATCPSDVEAMRTALAEQHPQVQLVEPSGEDAEPYGLVRWHTVTLVSSDAAVPVHARPIGGDTNEVGSMPALVDELAATYERTLQRPVVTADSGNTSLEVAGRIIAHRWSYFLQFKQGQGSLDDEARRALAPRRVARAAATDVDTQNGRDVEYAAWVLPLGDSGWMHWTHARQLVRIRRTTTHRRTGEQTVGNRYYVTSLDAKALDGAEALRMARAHWRAEEETHWTLDAELLEDRRQLAWSRHPNGVLAVAVLRLLGLACLAVARTLSHLPYTNDEERPSWHDVAEYFLLRLCDGLLDMARFDAV